MKSGCHLVRMKYKPVDSTSNYSEMIWNPVWNNEALPKFKNFIWRACSYILPMKKNLAKKNILVDTLLPMCGLEEESVCHALVTCQESQRIRFGSLIQSLSYQRSWVSKILSWY